ncbi:hypothetical protein FGO68_gene4247 [Halteria grandinella]|uniref:Uncharacterized protein n=1 Tax=Halteria grandinella TaxID=5974 RepID=A0A8J8NQ68_HALGN|nr:hypothetical protein FGO68_gene4247 [Halteria grandinella]
MEFLQQNIMEEVLEGFAAVNDEEQGDLLRRYKLIFMVTLLILTVFVAYMLYVFIQVRFKMQLSVKVLIFAFLFGFTAKTLADALRVFRNKITWDVIAFMQISTFLSDRIKIYIIFFFVFTIRELQIKVGSQSLEEYRDNKRLQKKLFITIMTVLTITQLGVFLIQILRSCHIVEEIDEITYLDLSLRCVFVLVELFMVLLFISVIRFLKAFKLERQKSRSINQVIPRLTPKQQWIYIMLNALTIAHLSAAILDLNYPIGLLLSDTSSMTGFSEISEYFGFILMNIVDFFMGMGILYLSLKMGQSELREKLMKEEMQQEQVLQNFRVLQPGLTDGRKDYTTSSINKLLFDPSSSSASLKQPECFTFDTGTCANKINDDEDSDEEDYKRFQQSLQATSPLRAGKMSAASHGKESQAENSWGRASMNGSFSIRQQSHFKKQIVKEGSMLKSFVSNILVNN